MLCAFTLKPGVKTVSGQVLTGERQFSFSTGGPAIRSSQPYEGSDQISEDQAFLLTLDALPDEASVIENVSFSVQGIGERIGVRIIKGEEEKEILKAHHIKADAIPRIVIAARQKFPNQAQVSLVWGQGVKTVSGVAGEKDQSLPFKSAAKKSGKPRSDRIWQSLSGASVSMVLFRSMQPYPSAFPKA